MTNISSIQQYYFSVLTDKVFAAQCVLFFIAGYDTTASTLSIMTFLLAKYPKEQQRLRQEMQNLHKEQGGVTYQGVMEAKFLDACLNGEKVFTFCATSHFQYNIHKS